MLSRRLRSRRMGGYTLSELMIGSALGLFIVSGVAFMHAELSKSSRHALAEAQLQRSLSTALAVMSAELRRAGYWSRARDTIGGGATNGYSVITLPRDDCVLYSYDRDRGSSDGRPRESDHFGFRRSGGVVQTKTSDDACGEAACERCDTGTWWAMTDPQAVTVTGLAFHLHELPQAIEDDSGIVVRSVEIELTGEWRRDPSITRSLTTLVNVRNDEIR